MEKAGSLVTKGKKMITSGEKKPSKRKCLRMEEAGSLVMEPETKKNMRNRDSQEKALTPERIKESFGIDAEQTAQQGGKAETFSQESALKLKQLIWARTTYYCGAWNGHIDTVKVLLESIAHDDRLDCLKAKDEGGKTTLHCAAVWGDTDTVKVLLESIAYDERLEYVRAKDGSGMTALHKTAMYGHTDTVKVLLESIEPDERLECLKAKDKRGRTALHLAAHEVNTIKYFIQSTEPEQRLQLLSNRNHDQDTALMLMAKMHDSEFIRQVIQLLTLTERFDCMKMQGTNGQTVLHALSANRQKADQSHLAFVVSLTGKFAQQLLKTKDHAGKIPLNVSETQSIKDLLAQRMKRYNLNKAPHVILFYTTHDRPLAREEKTALSKAFTSIGIRPDVYKDFAKDEALKAIEDACNQPDLPALIVAFMSHGNAFAIGDRDWNRLYIQDILKALGPRDGIPKVLIMQSCRDVETERNGTDGDGSSDTFHNITRDVMVVCAALHGCLAYQNCFIPVLAKHILQSGVDEDFDSIVKNASLEMEEEIEEDLRQVPEVRTTMGRHLCIKDFPRD